MEPMALGSPVSSPQSLNWGGSGPPIHSLSLSSPPHNQSQGLGLTSPAQYNQQPQQHPHHLSQSAGFLPSYLMGDPSLSSPASPGSLSHHRPMISPTKMNRTLSNPSAPTTPLPRGPNLLKENSSVNRSSRGTPGEKPSGPPTTSLLANLTPSSHNKSSALNASHYMTPTRPGLSDSVFPPQDMTPSSPPSDPLSTWVTVWGFPPSAASFVVQQMSGCGTVLQHIMPPNSNWMHIRFQTKLQASKAVGKNGSVIGSTIMVGVSACRDETVVDQLNSSTLDTSCSVRGQQGVGGSLNSSVANISSGLNNTPRTIRPLTQAYKEAQNENKVVPGTNTPNKSNGLVSKAMGCMFGW